ncbi:MAG: class I SAM-dependent methyltransferase [Acidimicrobiales bacterium]
MTAEAPGRSLARSLRLARAFRAEQQDPDGFYDVVSTDAVALLGRRVALAGALTLDVGGGAGYLTRALRAAGARCVLVDADLKELSWRGPPMAGSVVADGGTLPVPSEAVDLVVSSNVLEHVPEPFVLVDEMARVLRPGGHLWLSFTSWYGPWGGHETSPWHYLGGDRARRRYAARSGHDPKNVFGESLFALRVGPTLRRLAAHPHLRVVDARPRYLPELARSVVKVPVLRELLTWNVEVLAEKRCVAVVSRTCKDAAMAPHRPSGARS